MIIGGIIGGVLLLFIVICCTRHKSSVSSKEISSDEKIKILSNKKDEEIADFKAINDDSEGAYFDKYKNSEDFKKY